MGGSTRKDGLNGIRWNLTACSSACRLQFCIYVADFDRAWQLCANPNYGLPFPVTRKGLLTCPGSEACRKGRQRAHADEG